MGYAESIANAVVEPPSYAESRENTETEKESLGRDRLGAGKSIGNQLLVRHILRASTPFAPCKGNMVLSGRCSI